MEWDIELSNFVYREIIPILAKGIINHPQKGHGYVHATNFAYTIFSTPSIRGKQPKIRGHGPPCHELTTPLPYAPTSVKVKNTETIGLYGKSSLVNILIKQQILYSKK